MTAATPVRTPAGTSRLTFGIHAGTIHDLPVGSVISGLTTQERYVKARDAGFVLIQDGDDDLALRAGLERAAMGRVVHAGEARRLARHARERGCGSITLHVGTGFESDAEADALVVEILDASAACDIPIYIETHRATITQDPWRTLRLVERHPAIRFTGDFSHWYTGVELVYGDLEAKLEELQPIFDRVRFLHGRIGTPGSIQVDVGDGVDQPYVAHFREIWSRVFEAFIRNAEAHEQIVFAPELLSPVNYYALRAQTAHGELVEAGDRWEQAFVLCEIAAEAYAAAERRLLEVRSRPRDYYESCTQLKPGAAAEYERFHRAVPRRVDAGLRRAGVVSWQIYLRGDILTHCVGVEDRERMETILDADPTSPWWLGQANRYLLDGASPAVERPRGRLIWDLDWPTREDLDGKELTQNLEGPGLIEPAGRILASTPIAQVSVSCSSGPCK